MPLTASSSEENLKQVKKLLEEKPKVNEAIEKCKNSGGTTLNLLSGTTLNLLRMDLNDWDLEILIPYIHTEFPDLKDLNLASNQLTSLPDSIGNLKGLGKLHLGSNQLTSLPDSIGKLTSLNTLNVERNQLTSLPVSIGELTGLVVLRLCDNQLISLPESILTQPPILVIYVRNNPLSVETIAWLQENIPRASFNMAAHDQNTSVKNSLRKLYPTDPNRVDEIMEQLQQLLTGANFEVRNKKETAKEVLEMVLNNATVLDPTPNTPINQVFRGILEEVLENGDEALHEEQATTLQKLATALGDCGTPIKAYLLNCYVGQTLESLKCGKQVSDEAMLTIEREALEQFITTQLMPELDVKPNQNEEIEGVQGMLNIIYNGRLPSKTSYPDFALKQAEKRPALMNAFAEMFLAVEDDFEVSPNQHQLDWTKGMYLANQDYFESKEFEFAKSKLQDIKCYVESQREKHAGHLDFSDPNDLELFDPKNQQNSLLINLITVEKQDFKTSNLYMEGIKIAYKEFEEELIEKINKRVTLNLFETPSINPEDRNGKGNPKDENLKPAKRPRIGKK